jgi:hypothetical protein
VDEDRLARGFGILRGLKPNLPGWNPISATFVEDFHRALDHLAAAGLEVDEYRIPPDKLFRRLTSYNELTGTKRYTDDFQVDKFFLRTRIDSVLELDMSRNFRDIVPRFIRMGHGEAFTLTRPGRTADIKGLPQKDGQYDFEFGTDINEEDILTSQTTGVVYHVIKVTRGIHHVSILTESDYEHNKRLASEQRSQQLSGNTFQFTGGTNQVVVGDVEDSILVLRQTQSPANEATANALDIIKNAVVETDQLDDDQKEAALEFVQQISEEAQKPKPNKAR